MFELLAEVRRHRRNFAVWAVGTALILTAIALVPKDPTHGSWSRFAGLLLFALATLAGFFGTVRSWNRWSEVRLVLRYHDAPRPLAAALRYLLDERRLARRMILPSSVVAAAAYFAQLAARWPQAQPLAAWHGVLAAVMFVALATAILAPVLHRSHFINCRFLTRYLVQQSRFINFRPTTMQVARQRFATLSGPAVFRKGNDVVAGGFAWKWQDFTKNWLIQGQPGAGKTNCVLSALLEQLFVMLGSEAIGFSAFIQDIKGDWRERIVSLCRQYGLGDKLYIFDLHGDPARRGAPDCIVFNPFDSDDPALEVVSAVIAVFKTLGVRSHDSFFIDATKALMVNALVLFRAGLPEDEIPSVFHFSRLALELNQPAEKPAEKPAADGDVQQQEKPVRVSNWPFFDELCANIRERWRNWADVPGPVMDALDYVLREWKPMPDRQRAGIVGTLRQLTFELMAEPLCHFITGRSTVRIEEIIDQGGLFYLHAPLANNLRQALIFNVMLKALHQTAIRRRLRKKRPSFYLCDEFHNILTPGIGGDAQFFSLSRESNHANIIAGQNLPLLYQTTANKYEVTSLISNCATKLFLRNDDAETNETASRLFGEMSTIVVAPSESARFGEKLRRNHTNYARSTTTVRAIPPEAFTTLTVPTEERPYCQSIVHLGTREKAQRLTLYWKVHVL